MFRQLEKQTYLLYFKDGIIELLFAGIFIIHAVNTWFDMQELFRPYWLRVLLIPVAIILSLVKEFITKKRIGKVSFSKYRKRKTALLFAVVIAAQVFTLIIFILAWKGKIGNEGRNGIVGLLIEFSLFILVFAVITWLTGYNTFLLAGLAFAFSTPFILLLNPDLHQSYLRIGLMMSIGFAFLIVGSIRLIRFLRKYPKPVLNE